MFTQIGATAARQEEAKLKSTCVRTAIVIALLATSGLAQAATMYTGSINAGPGGGMIAEEDWNLPSTELEWTITDNEDGTWHYKYIFSHVNDPANSHIIFEISENVDDIALVLNESGGTAVLGQGGDPSNPSIPGDFGNALKFEDITGTSTTIEFDIERMPTWGDFYATGGSATSEIQGRAWNTGFTAGESGSNDPSVEDYPITTGEPLFIEDLAHILVPDSVATQFPDPVLDPVPEPAAAMLALVGLMGLAITRRRASRRA